MTHIFNFTNDANQDLLNAAKWYEKQQAGLGLSLLDNVDETIKSIDNLPLEFQIKLSIKTIELRFVPLQKFPYSIVYTLNPTENEIIIFAIWAHKKDPKKLKQRLVNK